LRRGAGAGLLAAAGYALAFSGYAILRTSVQIVATLTPGEGILGTLAANALSLMIAALAVTVVFLPVAAGLGALAMLLAHGILRAWNGAPGGTQAALVGGGAAALIMLAVGSLVVAALGPFRTAFWPTSFLFWLGLPGVCFVVAIARAARLGVRQ
jgi:hypothetical protein